MNLPMPFDETPLTVLRARRVVRNGSLVLDWTNPVEHSTPPGSLEGGDSREDHDRAEGVEVEFSWNGPVEADIQAADRVRFEYAGRTFEDYHVIGQPRLMTDPFGLVGYQLVSLAKREG
jgi:hypothetical protein